MDTDYVTHQLVKNMPVSKVTLPIKTLEMYVEDMYAVVPTVLPENATNKNVSFKSSDIGTVFNYAKNNICMLYAQKVGTATVTVTSEENKNITATLKVTVKARPPGTEPRLINEADFEPKEEPGGIGVQSADITDERNGLAVSIVTVQVLINATFSLMKSVSDAQALKALAQVLGKLTAALIELLTRWSLAGKIKVVWPVPGRPGVSTDYWGWRKHPETGKIQFHYGVDVGGGGSSYPIVAILDGVVDKVSKSASDTGRGAVVVMKHNLSGYGTFYTVYQHLKIDDELPKKGKEIKAGKKVANMGNTGAGKNIHLHFELMRKPPYDNYGNITYSLYSINPLGTYCDRDKRNTSRPVSTHNPQPLFIKDSKNNYMYNAKFSWNFADPVPENKSPEICSHHSSYAIVNSGESQEIRTGEG